MNKQKGLKALQYEADKRLLDNLVFLREQHGLSQTQLAERLNVPVGFVQEIETGEISLAPLLGRYANEIGATIEYQIKPVSPPAESQEQHQRYADWYVRCPQCGNTINATGTNTCFYCGSNLFLQ